MLLIRIVFVSIDEKPAMIRGLSAGNATLSGRGALTLVRKKTHTALVR